MPLLSGFRVLQLGPGLAAAVCGRLFSDVGAVVERSGADRSTPLSEHLNHGQDGTADIAAADLIICEGGPSALAKAGHDGASLRTINPLAPIVLISPFGQTGPRADDPATDLTLFFDSGIARMLTGQVDDLSEPPIRAVGEQSAFLGGLAAACAGMHAALLHQPSVVDVSMQEALATLAITELTRAGRTGSDEANRSWQRRRTADGNGATVCILPARDGFAAISPREDRQWAAWLEAMGSPAWGNDPRFVRKADRVRNWDALHALMSEWSRDHDKQWIADTAQAAHVPSFPLREPVEMLETPQFTHRRFYRTGIILGESVKVPASPFGLELTPGPIALETTGPLPLSGIRVLDFSWVIAGPTATRYLAAMGAEVIKIEAPGRGDPGRASELHAVLGQGKKAIVLDLKRAQAVDVARTLAAKADVVVENFATGVMERLGLGFDRLRADNPRLICVSASGLGRTGPEAHSVAYGTLLQCYAGFAGLNRHLGVPPRVGMAWLDPMCGLMLAFAVAASVWQRRQAGGVSKVDFSMIEAMLWTMAEPLLAAQSDAPPQPRGSDAGDKSLNSPWRTPPRAWRGPHEAWRCDGHDDWVALSVDDDATWRQLCSLVPSLTELSPLDPPGRQAARGRVEQALGAWLRPQSACSAALALRQAGIPAAMAATSAALVTDHHLRARGFWEAACSGVTPGLPWQSSFGRASGPAPALGAHTETVLRDMIGMDATSVAALRASGIMG